MKDKIYTLTELNKIREQGLDLCDCYLTYDRKCNLGAVEMYDHDGGIYVEGMKGKQWVYYTCKRCGYQWAWHKILTKVERQ